MQSGVLNVGAVDARNLNPDPRCVNVANYRATGLLSSGSDAGVPHIQVRENEPVTSTYVDPAINFTVASVGYVPGDLLTVEAEVRGTVPLDMSGQLTGYSGTVLEYVDNPTVTVTGAGWVKVRATARVVSVSGGYVRAIIRVNTSTTPVGEGFDVRRYLVVRNGENVAYFDGSTVSPSFTYEWAGVPDASESLRRVLVDTDSVAWVSRVLVGGVEREVDSWSVDREISGGLPSELDSSSSGITQATGRIVFSGADVAERPVTPMNQGSNWLPVKGDRVQVFVGDGASEWSQFVGRIDSVTGAVGSGFQATIIDDYDKLSAEARHVPLLRAMPPADGNGAPYRNIGLTALYYIDHFLRLSGFYCTPAFEANAVLAVHGQSSAWPVAGVLQTTAVPAGQVNQHPTVYRAPWGIALGGFTDTYALAENRATTSPIQLTMCVAPDHAGNARIQVYTSTSGKSVSLYVTSARVARLYVDGVIIVSMTLTAEETIVTALCKSGVVTMETNTGRTATGTATVTGGTFTTATIHADPTARIAGLQASHPANTAQEFISVRRPMTAKLNTDQLSLMSFMDAAPSFKGRQVAEVLSELCEAKLSSMWIDELGVMQWADAETLETRSPVRTVTTLDDIVSLGWRSALTQSASKVTITSKRPGITVGRYKNRVLPLASTGTEVLKGYDELEIFLEPPADVSWIMPVVGFTLLGNSSGSWSAANDPEKSLVGLYCTNDGGETELYGTGYERTITTTVLDYEKFLVKITAGAWASNVEGVMQTPENNTNITRRNRKKDLPVLVGQGRVEWSDREYSISDTGGAGPELVHDTLWWCSRSSDDTILQRYAEFLRDRTVNPQPFVDGLEIVPDPRIQVGDVITVESPSLLGAKFDVLIKTVSTEFSDNGLSMSFGVRVLNVTKTAVTFEEFQSALPGSSMTYAQFNSLAPVPQTFAEFNDE